MSPPGEVDRGIEVPADPEPAAGAGEDPLVQPEVGPELPTALVPQWVVQELVCTSPRVRESRAPRDGYDREWHAPLALRYEASGCRLGLPDTSSSRLLERLAGLCRRRNQPERRDAIDMQQPGAAPTVSPDGEWWWDGTRWVPMPRRRRERGGKTYRIGGERSFSS